MLSYRPEGCGNQQQWVDSTLKSIRKTTTTTDLSKTEEIYFTPLPNHLL